MWLVVGLGNPGRKYERNRHNIGFRAVDALVRRQHLGEFRDKFGGALASGMLTVGVHRHKALVLKPMEFMNRSGYAVQRTSTFYDVEVEQIVVIHDEIDIDFGRLKLKAGGGHGGHNGLRSLIEQLGSRAFLRVRAGVGRPGPQGANAAGARPSSAERDRRVAGYLLSDFPSALSARVDELVERAADAAEAIIDRGLKAAMNEFHSRQTDSLPGSGLDTHKEKPWSKPAN